MQIGDTPIRTPFEAPNTFDLDWRYQVAKGWADQEDWVPEFPGIYDDKVIIEHREYLRACRGAGGEAVAGRMFPMHKLVLDWANPPPETENEVKYFLEALLLTGAPMDVIVEDMGESEYMDSAAYALYEKLFFNIRKKDGNMDRGLFRRTRAVLIEEMGVDTPRPTVWRVIGHRLGYTGLCFAWAWEGHGLENPSMMQVQAETWRDSQALLQEQLVRRTISTFDLVNFLTAMTANERMRRETGVTASADAQELSATLVNLLRQAKPAMISAAKTVDEQAAETAAVQRRLLAQRRVSGQELPVDAPDKGEAGLDEILSKSFKGGQ
jgi:hypothetical protein